MASNIQGKVTEESMQLCEQIKQELKGRNLDSFIFDGYLENEELDKISNVKWEDEDQNECDLNGIFNVRFFCSSSDISDRFGYIMGFKVVNGELYFIIVKGMEDDNGSTFDDDIEELNLAEIYSKYGELDGFDIEGVLTEYLDVIKGESEAWIEK